MRDERKRLRLSWRRRLDEWTFEYYLDAIGVVVLVLLGLVFLLRWGRL